MPSRQLSRRLGPNPEMQSAASSGTPLPSPWTTPIYLTYGVIAGLGAVLFLVGTEAVSTRTLYDDQVPGINLAIVGTVLAYAAGVMLLLAGRRTVTARRVRVLGSVPRMRQDVALAARPASAAALIAGEGLVHFHRADCVMAAGREWPAVERDAHGRAGRIACGVCRP